MLNKLLINSVIDRTHIVFSYLCVFINSFASVINLNIPLKVKLFNLQNVEFFSWKNMYVEKKWSFSFKLHKTSQTKLY